MREPGSPGSLPAATDRWDEVHLAVLIYKPRSLTHYSDFTSPSAAPANTSHARPRFVELTPTTTRVRMPERKEKSKMPTVQLPVAHLWAAIQQLSLAAVSSQGGLWRGRKIAASDQGVLLSLPEPLISLSVLAALYFQCHQVHKDQCLC